MELIIVGSTDEDYKGSINNKKDEIELEVEDVLLLEAERMGISLSIEEAEAILEESEEIIKKAMVKAGRKAIKAILSEKTSMLRKSRNFLGTYK